ncbi:MAG: hypothetical protein ACNI3C_00540 [Candidatus Marinarcus sp.]|uniref:hypothetical protein n=1 Tax=Candidatus Marinarcus sp. TaxID=3100987 RepID=UPI003AFFBBE1
MPAREPYYFIEYIVKNMLSNRKISERFEVQINTLYNWQKTKPTLYRYLQNADYNYERNKEINVLLSEYSKCIQKNFKLEEIEYLIDSSLVVVSIEEIKELHKIFIKNEAKEIASRTDFILDLYEKILHLNIIEKYTLYKKIDKYRRSEILASKDIADFFFEFIGV